MNSRKNTTNQPKKKKRLNIRLCFVLGLVAYLCYAIICQQVTLHDYDSQIAALHTEIAASESELAEVNDLGALSESDTYIERIAREKLGLVLPDETVFVDITGK